MQKACNHLHQLAEVLSARGSVAAGGGEGGGGGGICPRAPVEGGRRRQDVNFKKILSCVDEERADKLMMSCRYVIVVTAIIATYNAGSEL